MPRINPLLLLKTLSVLLGPDGGIKESEDVQRVVNLMVRFSKKLVSKCIYVQILLATKEPLLDSFYSHGGWELVTGWFSDTCERENWRLLEDMLHLFKMSPVTVERLKTNQCPKQVKHLSKDSQCEVVKELALEVVDLWMKVIKGEPKDKKRHSVDSSEEADANNWKMEIRNGICVLKKVDADAPPVDVKEEVTATEAETKASEVQGDNGEVKKEEDGEPMDTSINTDQGEDAEMETEGQGDGKINIKKEDEETGTEKTEAENASDTEKKSAKKSDTTDSKKESQSKSSRSKKRENSSSRSDSRESKRKTDSGRDKRKSSSKSSSTSSSSSSRSESKKSSSRHSSKDSSRHREHRSRESEKQREREKEKEREKRKQSEKDKETLALVTGKGSLGRLGAIPKKAPGAPESKPASSPMTESKAAPSAGAGPTTKKAVAAPEPRKPTAKVFGAKFRSTGLLDAAPTSAPPKKKPEVARPKPPVLPKRLLPEPSGTASAEKRQRFEQRPPIERPGGIKVIPPKPLQLQEATGFMDALNSSKAEKKKSVRRVRRLSSKEDDKKQEEKKPEDKTEDATPEEKKPSKPTSPVTKPLLKFYQDTQAEIEEEEERERREKEAAASGETAPAAEGGAAAAKDAETNEKTADAPAEPEDEERASTPTIPLERRAPEEAGQPRGVLVYHRSSSRRKLSVSWKPERDLVAVQYFEMDENERVNVNRAKFLEMQTLEKAREREHMRRARMERDDGMAEQMPWQMLILVDRPPALVTPGARSNERVTQEQRELTSLPAFLNPSMLPDSPSEPDPELHEPTPCKPVPLEDDQGDANVKDFSAEGWPEARPEPRHLAPQHGHLPPQGNPHLAPSGLLPPPHGGWGPGGPMHPDAMSGPMEDDMPPNLMPPDLMSGAPMGMHPGPGPGFGGPQMMPPGGGWGPMGNPNMMGPGHMMGPPVPNMMMMGGPGPHFNSGGGGPGFRGGWRSAAEDARPPQRDIPCRHFNNGHCRKGMSCNFLHSAPRNGSAGGRSGRGRGGGRGWKDRQAQHEFV